MTDKHQQIMQSSPIKDEGKITSVGTLAGLLEDRDLPEVLEDVDVSGRRGKSDPIRVKLPAPPPSPPPKQIRLKILPERSFLFANYPNPFNPETWIPYQLVEDADVMISIYKATGQLIRTLNLGHKSAGFYIDKGKAAYWDGSSEEGELVSSGIYFYTIQAGDFVATKKMTITK